MFLNYRLKNYFCQALLVLGCLSVGVSSGMELEPYKEEAGQSLLERLPEDLIAYIATFLTGEDYCFSDEAIKDIKAYSGVSKRLYAVLADPQITNEIIELLREQFEEELPLNIALLLRTPAALEWIKSYLEKNPEEIDSVEARLGMAVQEGDLSSIDILINLGGDKQKILVFAAGGGTLESIKALIEAGADVNKFEDITPLIYAAQSNRIDTADLLIKAGADINQADKEGNTPLMMAVSKDFKEMVKFLLKAGAQVDIKDNDGGTALDLAQTVGCCKETIELLEKASLMKTN
jgi:hypothetical protein